MYPPQYRDIETYFYNSCRAPLFSPRPDYIIIYHNTFMNCIGYILRLKLFYKIHKIIVS